MDKTYKPEVAALPIANGETKPNKVKIDESHNKHYSDCDVESYISDDGGSLDTKGPEINSRAVLTLKFLALLAVILSAIVIYMMVKSSNQHVRYTCITGAKCKTKTNICQTKKPCSNGGKCIKEPYGYRCDCQLGYSGTNCERVIQIGKSAHFNRTGYVEFSRYFLSYDKDQGHKEEVIRLNIKTTHSDGLIFFHGREDYENTTEMDFIALAIKNGHIELRLKFDGVETNGLSAERIDDGYNHNITVLRFGTVWRLVMDNDVSEVHLQKSYPFSNKRNTYGNIFIGGVPHPEIMSSEKYIKNFKGCISEIHLQNKGPLRISADASGGLNVQKCH